MSNLFIGIILVLISFLPASEKQDRIDSYFREKIDTRLTVAKETDYQKNLLPLIPTKKDTKEEVGIEAKAAYFIDLKSGTVLFEKNPDQELPPASLAKLMTSLVVITKSSPEELVRITNNQSRPGDAVVGLNTNDQLSVRDLLNGILITSGSDATISLANHVAQNPENFTALMNEYANILGLKNTQFTNPVGWDESGNYSTAKDMTNLTRVALQNSLIRQIVEKEAHIIRSTSGYSYFLFNTNQLLKDKRYLGFKTGTTPAAGECFSVYYKDDEKEIVGVIMGSSSRFTETKNITDWINKNFTY